jgi:hypothetical protein
LSEDIGVNSIDLISSSISSIEYPLFLRKLTNSFYLSSMPFSNASWSSLAFSSLALLASARSLSIALFFS